MSKPVLFVSFRPLERAENIKAIYDYYDGPKHYICTDDPDFYEAYTSDWYSVAVTDDFPAYKRNNTIMIWHGIQGGKKIGLDQQNTPYYKREYADRMSYIISASTAMIPIWSQCTGVPKEQILPLGMPRTDEVILFRSFNEKTKERTYLFVPTFRDKGDTPFPDIDWAYIDSLLNDNERIIIKAHPWQDDRGGTDQVTNGIGNGMYQHIVVISPSAATTPFLSISDVIITDYSSIMFDAYLMNKPVVLFEKTPGYTETRGMYLDYPGSYCSFLATDEKQLVDMLRFRYSHPWLTDRELSCRYITAGACDGHSCERLSNLINQLKG